MASSHDSLVVIHYQNKLANRLICDEYIGPAITAIFANHFSFLLESVMNKILNKNVNKISKCERRLRGAKRSASI